MNDKMYRTVLEDSNGKHHTYDLLIENQGEKDAVIASQAAEDEIGDYSILSYEKTSIAAPWRKNKKVKE